MGDAMESSSPLARGLYVPCAVGTTTARATTNTESENAVGKGRASWHTRLVPIVLLCLSVFVTAPCLGEWIFAADTHPRRIARHMWAFSIQTGVRPEGLRFAASQYNFAAATHGIKVDYGRYPDGFDFIDTRVFYAIAPTLYDQIDGFINCGKSVDMNSGVLEGVVHSTSSLVGVHLR